MSYKNMKIGTKLIVLFLVAGLIPMLVATVMAYNRTSKSLKLETSNKLSAIMEIKKNQIEGWFQERKGDITVLTSFYEIADALQQYEKAFEDGGANGEGYRQVDNYYNPILKKYKEEYGYYDLFLISENGDVIYTVEREPDFATNIANGLYRDSGLGQVYKNAKNGQTTLTDFQPYAASNGVAASFIAAPVVQGGKTFGVVGLQLPLRAINKIMQERTGLGESGETYLVGNDYLMRSDSRFEKDPTVLKKKVQTEAVEAALSGKTDCKVVKDYRGIDVWSAYAKMNVDGLDWTILAEIDDEEAMAPMRAMRNASIILALIITAMVVVSGILVANSFKKPIITIQNALETVAGGDLTEEVMINTEDEIGQMAQSLNAMIHSLSQTVQNIQGSSSKVNQGADDLAATSTQLSSLAEEMTNQSGMVATAAEQVSTNVNEVSRAADNMSNGINTIADASEEMTTSVNTVATAVEEMTASLAEVAKNCGRSTGISTEAMSNTETAEGTMEQLDQAAATIGKVVDVISDIADQTNLLALNATIEAASAGDAGKGFAVVANEVKELAKQTAQATEEITEQIRGMQNRTTNAVSAIHGISKIMEELNAITNTISSAVEEQSSTMSEISQSIINAAQGASDVTENVHGIRTSMESEVARGAKEGALAVQDISQNIQGVNGAAEETSKSAAYTSTASKEMAGLAQELTLSVSQFKLKNVN